jgi:hypothetical protein
MTEEVAKKVFLGQSNKSIEHVKISPYCKKDMRSNTYYVVNYHFSIFNLSVMLNLKYVALYSTHVIFFKS